MTGTVGKIICLLAAATVSGAASGVVSFAAGRDVAVSGEEFFVPVRETDLRAQSFPLLLSDPFFFSMVSIRQTV